MKMTKLLIIFVFILLACGQTSQSPTQFEFAINPDGSVDILSRESGKVIIKNMTASYTLPSPDDTSGLCNKLNTANSDRKSRYFKDNMGQGQETIFTSLSESSKMKQQWTLRTFSDKAAVAINLEVINRGQHPIRIDNLNPANAESIPGAVNKESQIPIHYLALKHPITWGWLKDIKKLEEKGQSGFVTAFADKNDKGAVLGALSFNRFRTLFDLEKSTIKSGQDIAPKTVSEYHEPNEGETEQSRLIRPESSDNSKTSSTPTITIEAWHEIDTHLKLQPGDTLASEWIIINPTNDVFTGLEEWASLAGSLNNAVISDPPATGFYTWYYYREHVSEKIMIDNARYLAANRDRFPVNWVHIDWGWQRQFSTGDTIANEKFPHGFKWLAREIKDLGFSPSLWINPFMYTNPCAEAVLEHPEIFLRDSTGNLVEREPIRNIMGREFGNGEHMILDGVTNIIDVSNPLAYDFLEKRYQWVNSLGFDMAMMDFVQEGRDNKDKGDKLRFDNVSTFEGIKKSLAASQKGLGLNTDILGCGIIYETAVGYSNLTRISTDAPAIWSCAKTACKDILLQYFFNNRLWTNYADGLFVRDKISPYWRKDWWDENNKLVPMRLSDEEAKFYTAVTGLSQSAVMITEDIPRLKPERQWMLSLVLPIYDKGLFRPRDLFRQWPARTLQLKCQENDRSWVVAAGLNWTDTEDPNGLDCSQLDLDKNTLYHAFDVFEQKYLGQVPSSAQLGPIAPRCAKVVNLIAASKSPQFVGSDLHISQGGVEISHEDWETDSKTLRLGLKPLHGRKGNLWIWVPAGLKNSIKAESSEKIKSSIKFQKINLAEGACLLGIPVKLNKEKTLSLTFD